MKINSLSHAQHSQNKILNEKKDSKPVFTRQEKIAAPSSNRDGIPVPFPAPVSSIQQPFAPLSNGVLPIGGYIDHATYFGAVALENLTGYAGGSNTSSAIIPSMLNGRSDLEGIENRSSNMNLEYEVARHHAAIERRPPSMAAPFIRNPNN